MSAARQHLRDRLKRLKVGGSLRKNLSSHEQRLSAINSALMLGITIKTERVKGKYKVTRTA